jgi:WD40 repeat protein
MPPVSGQGNRPLAALTDGWVRGRERVQYRLILAARTTRQPEKLPMFRFLPGAILALLLPTLSFSADAQGDPLPPGAVARIGTTRLRHAAYVSALAFSPDGRRISSATIWFDTAVWDARTGRALAFRSSRRGEGLFCAAVSPDGSLFAGRTDDRKLGVQEALGGKFLHRFSGKKEPCEGLVFSRDNHWLASADFDGNTYLWDLRARKLAHRLKGKPPGSLDHYCHAFTPDGAVFIQARADGITLRDVQTGTEIRHIDSKKEEEWPGGAAVSPDGKLLAVRIGSSRVDLWEIKTGRHVRKIAEQPDAVGLVFSPDGKHLVTGRDPGEICFWEVETGKRARSLSLSKEAYPMSLAFSPDGKLLAAGSDDHAIRIWDLASGKGLLPVSPRLGGTPSMRFLSDGKTLLVHCRDGMNSQYATIDDRLSFWDLRGSLLRQANLVPQKAHACALSGDARTVAYGTGPNFGFMLSPVPNGDLESSLRLCEAASGKQLVQEDGMPCQIHDLTFSPDGRFLLVNALNAGPNKCDYHRVDALQIWKRTSPTRLEKVADIPTRSFLSGWCVSPDSRWVVVASKRGCRFHDCETGKLIRSYPDAPGSVVAVSPSGRVLVSRVGDDDARTGKLALVWEKATGKTICKLSCQPDQTDWSPLVVSPEGRFIAGCLDREVIALWDAFTGKQLAKLEGHRGDIGSLAFSPDGRYLVSASADTTVLVWDWRKELPKTPGTIQWSAERLEQLWQDLQGSDPRPAYLAIAALLRSPGQAIDLVRRKARPVGSDARIERWIEELDSDRYEVRETAMKELTDAAELAEGALRRTLAASPSLEARRRIVQLLDRLPSASLHPSTLATVRSLELLEMIDTPQACKLVEEVAPGLGDGMSRREAEETLHRLKRRGPERDRIPPLAPPRRPHP